MSGMHLLNFTRMQRIAMYYNPLSEGCQLLCVFILRTHITTVTLNLKFLGSG